MKIRAIDSIHYDGSIYGPGAEFECRKVAAKRLMSLGVAGLPVPVQVVDDPADEPDIPDATAEKLEQIAAATSLEALGDLFPEQPESEELAAAFEARWEALEQQ
jgi:hypothetical protein